uniref:G2/M-phase specific E3 ubiquitin protein ligase n=1 Tax=Astyanax mexicanus TaxID=7994 RepID=W5KLH1_ASTMX
LFWNQEKSGLEPELFCQLCNRRDNCPDKYGEKFTLKKHNITVHYFCLLMSSGIFQRGKEHEGIHGFLVDDIKQEIRRSSRLRCVACKKVGASVGCFIKSCRQMVHMPCGVEQQFIFQFTDSFPSFCKKHRPTQTCSSVPTLPVCCSICLEHIEPVLSYSVLKCPACHGSWFHRNCVQYQAHSAAKFFFKCTLCNNKDQFQQEMLRMGIHIPERDASWELEDNAYGELLEVYQHCDAVKCSCEKGRGYSAETGVFEIVRCKFCGSRGTHRKCSSLKNYETSWSCIDCKGAAEGTGVFQASTRHSSPKGTFATSLIISSVLKGSYTEICLFNSRRCVDAGPAEILMDLATQLIPHQTTEVLLKSDQVLEAALQAVRQSDFNPCHRLSVRFIRSRESHKVVNQHRFLSLLLQDLQNSCVFEGPEGSKNLALNSQGELLLEVIVMMAVEVVEIVVVVVVVVVILVIVGGNSRSNNNGSGSRGGGNYVSNSSGSRRNNSSGGISNSGGGQVIVVVVVIVTMAVIVVIVVEIVGVIIMVVVVEVVVIMCAASLEDILLFATATDVIPAIGYSPAPMLSFFTPLDPSCAFPQSQPEANHLILPVLPSYELFKKHLEYSSHYWCWGHY